MSLFVQLQCCVFSFVYGFSMVGVYHLFNRLLWRLPVLFKGVIHFMMGIAFAFVFYQGMVFFDYGILYIYDFIFLFLGYCIYQKYYAYYELMIIEKQISYFKKIIHPFIFFLKKINAIMKNRVRKVMKKWQKENQDSKNS